MARIPTVSRDAASPDIQQVYDYGLQGLSQLTALAMPERFDERKIEPLTVFAHIPALLHGYVAFEGVAGQLSHLEPRTRALAELKAATLTHCEYCIDLGSQISRQSGLKDDELIALANYRESAIFDAKDRAVLDYAVAMSVTPVDVSDSLVEELRSFLADAQIVELSFIIALENLRGRFNLALGIGSAGFSEGMVCAVPARAVAAV